MHEHGAACWLTALAAEPPRSPLTAEGRATAPPALAGDRSGSSPAGRSQPDPQKAYGPLAMLDLRPGRTPPKDRANTCAGGIRFKYSAPNPE